MLLERIVELVEQKKNFSFETTLAARSYRKPIVAWREMGYRVVLFFLWLPSVELAINRVAMRVREGGHDIPVETISRRYSRGLENLFEIYLPLVSESYIYDASGLPPSLVCVSKLGVVLEANEEVLDFIRRCRKG